MTLVAHWPLDEDSGTTATDVAGAHDGTINGATVGATGILGTTCYSFDGTDDHVNVAHSGSLEPSELTATAWFKSSEDGTVQTIVNNDGPRFNLGYALRIRSDVAGDPVRFVVADTSSSTVQVSSTTDVNDGAWHHVVGVIGGSGMSLYVDGVEEDTDANTSVTYDASTNFYIGQRADAIQNFNGEIDEVRIYDRALTPQEVQYLYDVTQRGDYTSSIKTL